MSQIPNLNVELTDLNSMPFKELKALYDYFYNVPTNSTRREFYIWRVAYRLQELRFGGLDAKTKQLLENMEEGGIKVTNNALPIGTEMVRKFKGATYRLRIVAGGIEMDGEFYKSLSAVAQKITGRKISGKDFFGV